MLQPKLYTVNCTIFLNCLQLQLSAKLLITHIKCLVSFNYILSLDLLFNDINIPNLTHKVLEL